MSEAHAVRPGVLLLAARDIKLSHSVFALPFAVLGACLAKPGGLEAGPFAARLALVVVCMVFARTWAMLVNRLADARIDAENPRTARRAFASGAASARHGWMIAAGAGLLFIGAAGVFAVFGNFWPLMLSIPVLGWIALYSWTKRFTWACHLVLGSALAVSPVAAAIAVDPASVGLGGDGVSPAIWPLAGMVMCWVAGFDVIYALQDLEFDRARGLFSIPAALGAGGAIWASRALHLAAWGFLTIAWRAEPRFGAIFGAAWVLIGALLVAEHLVLARRGKAGLEMAFFTINGVVSLAAGLLGCIDLTW